MSFVPQCSTNASRPGLVAAVGVAGADSLAGV
jgi:hypothetical protein